ncbi:putative molybdenum carrier protein [Aromatoleum toluclasticum]|uniref:putative molybdenum carrier protein n=1 Tax=Aromatoleum toluclasticum TaxID=92003 RepID=UPI001D18BB46|nr:putative molybdenum carrier protein [Aromatoleum toluclasticum]MCC4115330.1 putative molybdenum carrier protein [Aromatoleum toluclasticum]
MYIVTIVSGGQTGADRAALDWAIARGLQHGGWCPAGRLAEDGLIPERYQLKELHDGGYRKRTLWNVRDSDATLIISLAPELTGGSAATMRFARSLKKPWLHVSPGMDWQVAVQSWLRDIAPGVLNIAGPRASSAPGIEAFTWQVLDGAFPK